MKYICALFLLFSSSAMAFNTDGLWYMTGGFAKDGGSDGGEISLGRNIRGPIDLQAGYLAVDDQETWTLGMAWNEPLHKIYHMQLRAGLHSTNVDGNGLKAVQTSTDRHDSNNRYGCKHGCSTTETTYVNRDISDNDESYYLGAGIQAEPNNQLFLYLRHTYYDMDMSKGDTDSNKSDHVTSAGVGFRF